jgi:hypothetical protein
MALSGGSWKPGQSGNPMGRAKHKPFTDALRVELAAAGEDGRKLRQIAAKVIELAEEGDLEAVKLIWDRLEGRPMQQVDITATVEQIPPKERLQRILELQGKVVDVTPVSVPQIEGRRK